MRKSKQIVKSALPTNCPACKGELQEFKDIMLFDADTETEILRDVVRKCNSCNIDYFIENNSLVKQLNFSFGIEGKFVHQVSDQELARMKMNDKVILSN